MRQYEERLRIIRQSVNMEVADRVPFVSNLSPWPVAVSPYSYPEVYYHPERITEVWTALEKYGFDAHVVEFPGANCVGITQPLGEGAFHIIRDSGVSVQDNCLVEYEELREYAKNKPGFLWTTVIKRKFPALKNAGAAEKIRESMGMMNRYMTARKETRRIFAEEQGVALIGGWKDPKFVPDAVCPIEEMFSYARGMRNTALDMRKHKEEYGEILELFAEHTLYKELEKLKQSEYGTSEDALCDLYLGMLAHNMLNRKQFETYYWPHLSKLLHGLIERGRVVLLYAEGSILRFSEYFQEFPKGNIILYSENDDIFELRKAFPNFCILGGMPVQLLGRGTEDECCDYAKRLIDGLAGQGGYMFSTDKFMCTLADGKPENLLAVARTVREYGHRR